MPILLGVAASLLIGISDALGRAGTRRANPVSHVSTAMVSGSILSVGLSLLLRNTPLAGALAFGAVSGIFVSLGLTALYRGMAETSAAVVAPPTAVFAAMVPFGWDLIRGARPSALAIVGCITAIAFLGLSTLSRDSTTTSKGNTQGLSVDEWIETATIDPATGDGASGLAGLVTRAQDRLGGNGVGLLLGVGAGILLGIGTVCIAGTDSASGAWPAAAQRVVGFGTMAALATRQREPILLPKDIRHIGLISGIAGTVGIVCLVLGVQSGGDLGLVAVAGSMFPAVAIVLSTVFDGDQIRWWQVVGLVGSIVGVSLIALGQ